MAEFYTLKMNIEVSDPQALWDKANEYLRAEIYAGGEVALITEAIRLSIGSRDKPDIGACLIMLLDHNSNLAGGKIEDTQAEFVMED